jgi:hypothetical protein
MSALDSVNLSQESSVVLPETPGYVQDNTVCEIAQCALQFLENAAFHTALIMIKIVVIPIECSVLVLVATATALSILFSWSCSSSIEEGMKPTLFHHTLSLLDEICQVIKITFKFGIVWNQTLQLADNEPGSPQFFFIQPHSNPQMNEEGIIPILYAPGYLDNPETLLETGQRIADASGAPVYAIRYRSLFQSIEEHAKDVERVAERAFRDSQQSEIMLAGHSMGGLVTGWYILHHSNENVNVKLWITIASPLEGTNLAYLGLGDCAKQMRPHSTTINTLRESDHLNQIPSLHIYSLTDHVVPSDSAKREGRPLADNYLCKRPLGHLGVRSCPEVEEQIFQAIRGLPETC